MLSASACRPGTRSGVLQELLLNHCRIHHQIPLLCPGDAGLNGLHTGSIDGLRHADSGGGAPRGERSPSAAALTARVTAGPRKLRLGRDLGCLVECTPLAGPTPDEVGLPTAVLQLGSQLAVDEAAARFSDLNMSFCQSPGSLRAVVVHSIWSPAVGRGPQSWKH